MQAYVLAFCSTERDQARRPGAGVVALPQWRADVTQRAAGTKLTHEVGEIGTIDPTRDKTEWCGTGNSA